MNPQAKSDTSLASCVHCAMQLNPSARVCPRCGEDTFVDGSLADAAWFDEASVNAPSDHVLEAMMAIAAAKPKAVSLAAGAFVPPGPPALIREPSVAALQGQTSALSPASPLRLRSSLARRALGAGVAVSALAALTAVLLNANGISFRQRAEPNTDVALSSAASSPARDGAGGARDHEAVPLAAPEPSPPRPASPPARAEDDAQAIAAALGLGGRPEPAVPAPAPRVAPLPAPAADAPSDSEASKRCSEALAALALCREP